MVQNGMKAIGERIQAMRKDAGIKSTQALADLIGSPEITGAVLRNVEAGLRKDLGLTLILEIAIALEAHPSVLLFDYSQPDEVIDLPAFSPTLSGCTAAEIDRWLFAPEIVRMPVPNEDPGRPLLSRVTYQQGVVRYVEYLRDELREMRELLTERVSERITQFRTEASSDEDAKSNYLSWKLDLLNFGARELSPEEETHFECIVSLTDASKLASSAGIKLRSDWEWR